MSPIDLLTEKVEMELKVPKSLIVALWVIGVGLVLNGVQPFLSTPAVANGTIHKVAICDPKNGDCVTVAGLGKQKFFYSK